MRAERGGERERLLVLRVRSSHDLGVFLDLSLDREAILNSLSKSARIELEQRVGPNVLRKLGGIIITIFLNLHRLAGT